MEKGNWFPACIGQEGKGMLTGSRLKLIAIVCMLIDHIAWGFVPTASVPGALMHTVGRITAPVMCFMLTEGYRHTHDFKRYALRLMIFAAVSYLPFIYFQYGCWTFDNALTLNMIYTLFLCLLGLWADEHLKDADRTIALFVLGFLSLVGDWPVAALMFTLNFSRNRSDRKRLTYVFTVISAVFTAMMVYSCWIQGLKLGRALLCSLPEMGTLLALPLLDRYNGQKGKNVGGKWLFYWFYPVHLAILGLIRFVL